MKPLVLTTLAIWLLAAPGAAAADSQEAWAALVNGSHVALIRHGNAPPGYGDPPGFRCLETARLMVLGPVEGTWAVAASDRGPERLAALRQMLADWRGPGTLVVVTHTLTVQALVGFMPGQAETVVVRPKLGNEPGVEVVGRIPSPE